MKTHNRKPVSHYTVSRSREVTPEGSCTTATKTQFLTKDGWTSDYTKEAKSWKYETPAIKAGQKDAFPSIWSVSVSHHDWEGNIVKVVVVN